MKYPLKVTKENFYDYLVRLINPILKLRNRELDVLAKLMYYNNEHKEMPEEYRFKIIFDYDTKTKIAEELKVSLDVLNNNFSVLRSKGIIVDNQLAKGFRIYHDGENFELAFKFEFIDVGSP